MIRTALLFLVGLVLAGGLAVAAPARAEVGLESFGVVWGKDLQTRTLTIGHQTYHINLETTFYGSDWLPITMEQVPMARDREGRMRGVKQAAVEFSALEHRGRLYLDALRLVAATD